MALSSQRQRFSIFVSPRNEDFLFYEKVDKQRVKEAIPEYGTPHPDYRKYPNHFFAQAVQADEDGQIYYYYYAAKRESQDDYNWEHTTVDYKTLTYDMVERTYVLLRSEYDDDAPALGTAMPITDEDPFEESDGYILVARKQDRIGDAGRRSTKIGDKELDSMFVLVRRVYLKRSPITTSTYDKATGAHIFRTTNLVHKDEIPAGGDATIAELMADPDNAYWEVDEETGSHTQVEQVSEEWYYVVSVVNGDASKRRVFLYVTPDKRDYIFYELVDRKDESDLPAKDIAFGDPHDEFSNHKFVAAVPNDSAGDFYRHYYAADRLTQDTYNWAHTTSNIGGARYDAVERTYVIPRADYSESSPALATPMPVTAQDPFDVSDDYILVNRRKQELTGDLSELSSIYVLETREYIKRVALTQTSYNDNTGYHTFRETELWHKDEVPTGQTNTISYLMANTDDDFWLVDPDTGAHKVVEQVSAEWYTVTSVFKGDENERRVFVYTSPDQRDYIFYELVDRKDEKVEPQNLPAFGTPHPTYTNHVFIAATPADSIGDFYRFYYAAPRLEQEVHNWAYASADLGSNRYQAVERTFLLTRDGYDEESPAIASSMPISASDPFEVADDYILISRTQQPVRGDLAELDSIFVLDVRRYIKRAPLTTVNYNETEGVNRFTTTQLWHKNEIPTGATAPMISLVADTGNAYWSVDNDGGEYKEVQQVSSEWFAVSLITKADNNDRRVFIYVTPNQNDFIFYEIVDRKNESEEPANLPAYGTRHPEYLDHKFVAAVPADAKGDRYRMYYAATRANQDEYNWDYATADLGGNKYDVVERTYVVPRNTYDDSTPALNTAMPVTAGDPFDSADGYILLSREQDQLSGGDEELRSLFILDRRTYIKRVPLTSSVFDEQFGKILTNTITIKHRSENPEDLAHSLNSRGYITEVRQLSADWFSVEEKQVMNVDDGSLVRAFFTTEVFSWPTVLAGFDKDMWELRGRGDNGEKEFTQVIYPVYSKNAYTGPTYTKVEIFWSNKPFDVKPDKPMIAKTIDVILPTTRYQASASLHTRQRFQGYTGYGGGKYVYTTWNKSAAATNYTDWPDKLIASDDQRPYRGGYLRQRTTVYHPDKGIPFGEYNDIDTTTTYTGDGGPSNTARVYGDSAQRQRARDYIDAYYAQAHIGEDKKPKSEWMETAITTLISFNLIAKDQKCINWATWDTYLDGQANSLQFAFRGDIIGTAACSYSGDVWTELPYWDDSSVVTRTGLG